MNSRHILMSLLIAIIALSILPTLASATTWTSSAYECGGADAGHERDAGQLDQRGYLYLACTRDAGVARANIRIIDRQGIVREVIRPSFGGCGDQIGDVAPAADGSFLYVTRSCDQRVYRLVRSAGGGYAIDAGWRIPDTVIDGDSSPVRGMFVASDASNNLYVSAGPWANTALAIVKVAPDGHVITVFGAYRYNSWALGDLYGHNEGIAVTADGSTVYMTEVGNNRIQVWKRQTNGTYVSKLAFGNTAATDPTREGLCNLPVRFAAPYDIGIGPDGTLYIVNTTCRFLGMIEVHHVTATGAPIEILHGMASTDKLVHGIAVDRRGVVYLGQGGLVLVPQGIPVPRPTLVPRTSDGRALEINGFLMSNTGTGGTEQHSVVAAGGGRFTEHTGTALHYTNATTWKLMSGNYDGDRVSDMYAVTAAGSSGLEVHVTQGASHQRSFIEHSATGLTVDSLTQFALGDYDDDLRDDLYVLRPNGSLIIRTAASHFTTGPSFSTGFTLTAATISQWWVLAGDYDRDGRADLYLLRMSATGTRSTEVHVLSAASRFRTYVMHTGTALHETTKQGFAFAIADPDQDGRSDVIAIKLAGASGTEIHQLSGATDYQRFALQTATALGNTNATQWQFSAGTR